MIYLILFLEFFKIGLFTIGGGFAMIPLIEETVVAHGWLTQGEFFDLVGVCESTPGPIAVNMATYIGSQQGGLFGSCAATLGVVLPSFLIILLIASIMKNLTNTKAFKGFMEGVKPVVTALILATGVLFLVKAVGFAGIGKFDFDPVAVIIFALVCGIYFVYKAVAKKKISSVALIIISAALGIGVSMIFEVTA
ncbi:MAG: chromate transporter [Ruminococcaceae bacterium]|nr:chromate transporter [Oscillospiraceae bacterium]